MRQTQMLCRRRLVCVALALGHAGGALAQTVSHRGFVEGIAFTFPQETPEDRVRVVGDLLAREEVSVKPAPWLRFAAGVDFRANSHDQVDDRWRIDLFDRGARRPRLSMRRLAATVARGPFTLEIGKQFIRWGKTDIVAPTDRFAPRDFLNVVDSPFLAVTAVRGTVQTSNQTFDLVWAPRFTPSRTPLLGQRWAVLPPDIVGTASIVETPAALPRGSQVGIRWGQVTEAFEYSVSFYNGFNHQPEIRIGALDMVSGRIGFSRAYPTIRTYGVDSAVPVPWFTIKAEAAYFTSSSDTTDEYVLYVVQLERQSGEWVFVGGYVGEAAVRRRAQLSFSPERGLTRAIVARAAYTIDTNRSVELEGAARQDGKGVYAKAEYSQARGQHWRTTVSAVALGGDRDDFLGQYRRNSHVRLTVRYSF
jgi:hypothetical protein